MKILHAIIWSIWTAGIFGWNAAGSNHDDKFTPKAFIWPAVVVYHFTHDFYERTQVEKQDET